MIKPRMAVLAGVVVASAIVLARAPDDMDTTLLNQAQALFKPLPRDMAEPGACATF